MERYLQLASIALAVVAFVPAFFFFFVAAKHFVQMLTHFRSGRHDMVANLLPFLIPFMPHLFTEQGNIHRAEFVTNMGWFLCCFAFIVLVFGVLGVKA